MANVLYGKAKGYIDFEIWGKKVKIPYVLAKGKRWHFFDSSGKGTPEQINAETVKAAKNKGVDLSFCSPFQISKFMRQERIGIDCSGFVYHLLKEFVKETEGKDLNICLLRYKGFVGKVERALLNFKRARRISAEVLTSNINTVKIEKVSQIKPGDLLRLTPLNWSGKHIAIVVGVTPNKVIYAHSSRDTKRQGPHFGEIEILNRKLGLESQKWLEITKAEKNYGEECFKIEKGDSVRRLTCLL